MQAYSTIKGKSNSDDGDPRSPEHIIPERDTVSDDGFDSFPVYSRRSVATRDSDNDVDDGDVGDSEDDDENFYSCDSDIQSYKDAQSHHPHSDPEQQTSQATGRDAHTTASPQQQQKKKQKRRRPKKKNKESSADEDAGASKVAREGEARELTAEELIVAMEHLRLWKERGAGR